VALTAALLLICGGLLCGCSSLTGEGTAKPVTVEERVKSEEKHIETIKNNPNIPENVKAQQIGMIQANLERIKKAQPGSN